MLRILLFSVLVFLIVGLNKIWAQDAQFSQFYAAPLYLNPAFAGAAQEARVGINYRNQWPQIDEANFETISAYFDTYFYESNSGVGLIINRDKEGFAGLRSTNVLSIRLSVEAYRKIDISGGRTSRILHKRS